MKLFTEKFPQDVTHAKISLTPFYVFRSHSKNLRRGLFPRRSVYLLLAKICVRFISFNLTVSDAERGWRDGCGMDTGEGDHLAGRFPAWTAAPLGDVTASGTRLMGRQGRDPGPYNDGLSRERCCASGC